MSAPQEHPICHQRKDEFFHYFYNDRLWESKGQENHPNYGRIEVHQMCEHHYSKIRGEKTFQIENAQHQDHKHSSHQVLPAYRAEQAGNLPKWLPYRIGVKTTPNIPQLSAENIMRQVDANLENLWQFSPEFNRVFGYQMNGNELSLFIELQPTLEQDILTRRQENRPYQEELLWKMLFNLTKAATRLNQQNQYLHDIRPSRVYYNDFQISVTPAGIAQERDLPLATKFNTGENIFYANEIIGDFQQQQSLRQSGMLRGLQANESFQIGMTVLSAGLLQTEGQLPVCRNRQFDQQGLEHILEDFGRIYGNHGRLLQFTLEEFYLRPNRRTPAEIFQFFESHTEHFLFLEQDLQHHLKHVFEHDEGFCHRRREYQHHHPQIQLDWDFKQHFPQHFYYELKKYEFETRMAELQAQGHHHHHHHHHDDQQQQQPAPVNTEQPLRQSQQQYQQAPPQAYNQPPQYGQPQYNQPPQQLTGSQLVQQGIQYAQNKF